MAVYLKPRRGKKATAINQGIILKRGEIFFEVPDTGVGTGRGRIKIGDGSTSYGDLPYFINPEDLIEDVDDTPVIFSTSTLTDINELLDTIISGTKLKDIIGSIKKALSIFSGNINTINDTLEEKANDDEVVKLASYNDTIGTSALSAWYPNSAFGKVKITDNIIFALNETSTQLTERVITLNNNIKSTNTNLNNLSATVTNINSLVNQNKTDISDLFEMDERLEDIIQDQIKMVETEILSAKTECIEVAQVLYQDNKKSIDILEEQLLELKKKVNSYHS